MWNKMLLLGVCVWSKLRTDKYNELITFLTAQIPLGKTKYRWIKANVGQTGFYRVNYDQKNWNRLTNQLSSNHKARILFPSYLFDFIFRLEAQL